MATGSVPESLQTERKQDRLDGQVHLWNPNTDQAEVLTPDAGNIWQIALTPDGKTMAIGTQDGVLKLFNLPTRREICSLRGHLTVIQDLGFSPEEVTHDALALVRRGLQPEPNACGERGLDRSICHV